MCEANNGILSRIRLWEAFFTLFLNEVNDCPLKPYLVSKVVTNRSHIDRRFRSEISDRHPLETTFSEYGACSIEQSLTRGSNLRGA